MDRIDAALWVACEDASTVSVMAELDDQVAAWRACAAGDEDVHLVPNHRERNAFGVPTS